MRPEVKAGPMLRNRNAESAFVGMPPGGVIVSAPWAPTVTVTRARSMIGKRMRVQFGLLGRNCGGTAS